MSLAGRPAGGQPRQWDLWTAIWPDDPEQKPRPVILFSDMERIARRDPLVFIKVSTKHYDGVPDLRLSPMDGAEWCCTGLREVSYIHYTAVREIPWGNVGDYIGRLGPSTVEFLIDLIKEASA